MKEELVPYLMKQQQKVWGYGVQFQREREVAAKLVAKPLNLGIIQEYKPTSGSEDVEVEKFYEEIEKAKGYLKSQDTIIIMGDYNAKIEMKG
ncbi:craniofacial development protein 2-like protein [Plakobranchus ocellatus]|uniref:Craniofacial development protein 2-like protein n=1 Tax=Plakobranchus ocellatus TaxID=259542 RepID=A0AAV4D5D0_9GAST|nr:craniofacial development protein 2-like protein [Plakobranchus ocellatus]